MSNTIDNKEFLEIIDEYSEDEINSVGWDGGVFLSAVENITSNIIEYALNSTDHFYNNHNNHSGSFSDNYKLLVSNTNVSTDGNNNDTKYEPQIPEYIRTTSMVFCIAIMCLGVVGNIMVSSI